MKDATDSICFSDAHALVMRQLQAARVEVVCAIAGACARPLFDLLLGCRRRGLALTVVVPGDAQDSTPGIAWERLEAAGATLHWLARGAPILYTSLCVIDAMAVLSGDLARLGPVPDPHTAGVLLPTNSALAARCKQDLGNFTLAYAQRPDASRVAKTEAGVSASGAAELVAIDQAQKEAASWQTVLLEAHTLAMQADIAEMHRTLNAFDREQDACIGDLLRQYMDAKRRHLQGIHAQDRSEEARAQAEEAQERFEQYTRVQDAKPMPQSPLDPVEQAQMKQLYRKLAMRLHPDRVEVQDKSEAQALFQHLQTSYESNDFSALKLLQQQLPQLPGVSPDGAFSLGTRRPADQAVAMHQRLAQQQRERASILCSATWQTLSTQSNWAVWFAQQAQYLRSELERYEQAATWPPSTTPVVHTP